MEYWAFCNIFEDFPLAWKVNVYNKYAKIYKIPLLYLKTDKNIRLLSSRYTGEKPLDCRVRKRDLFITLGVSSPEKIRSYNAHKTNLYIENHYSGIFRSKCWKMYMDDYRLSSYQKLSGISYVKFIELYKKLPLDVKVKVYNLVNIRYKFGSIYPKCDEEMRSLFCKDVNFKKYIRERSYYFSKIKEWEYNDGESEREVSRKEVLEIVLKSVEDIYYIARCAFWCEYLAYKPFVTNIKDLPDPDYGSTNLYYLYDKTDKSWYMANDSFTSKGRNGRIFYEQDEIDMYLDFRNDNDSSFDDSYINTKLFQDGYLDIDNY